MSRQHRLTIAWASFIILVVALPLAFGIGWNEHQRNEKVAQIVKDRRALLIDSCERGNIVRARLNEHIETTREQVSLMIDYMRTDALAKGAPADAPERQAIKRLLVLLADTNKVKQLPIVDCEATIR